MAGRRRDLPFGAPPSRSVRAVSLLLPARLKENVISFVSLAPSVTLWRLAPSFSCHASIVYVPGGRPFSSNLPSSFVTAKYG